MLDNSEDLKIVVSLNNLLKYSKSYSMISGSLWNFYREEIDGVDNYASDGDSFE